MSIEPQFINNDRARQYTGLITILKIIQYVGYFFAVVYYLAFARFFSYFGIIWVLSSCLGIYVTLQSLIAIIDLLSRIEWNTRADR